jgi:ATP-binding cassette, subfamily B, bacterial HlyB/CyaB
MPHATHDSQKIDTGLTCLVMLARLHGLPADPQQLLHEYGRSGERFDTTDLLLSAKTIGLKARSVNAEWQRLEKLALPAIARFKDGRYVVLAKWERERVLIQDPLEQKPQVFPRELFEQAWAVMKTSCGCFGVSQIRTHLS